MTMPTQDRGGAVVYMPTAIAEKWAYSLRRCRHERLSPTADTVTVQHEAYFIDEAIKEALASARAEAGKVEALVSAATPLVQGLGAWDLAQGMHDVIQVRIAMDRSGRECEHTIRQSNLRALAAALSALHHAGDGKPD